MGKFKKRLILVGVIIFLFGFFGCVLIWGLIVVLIWVVLWFIIGIDVLLGGNIFGIFIVIVFVSFCGFFVCRILYFYFLLFLGMFLVGFFFWNVCGIDLVCYIDKWWFLLLWSMVLVVIFICLGFGLNILVFRKLKFILVRLVFFFCILEVVIVVILVYFLLDMKWFWVF